MFFYCLLFLIDVFLLFRIEPDACHSIVIRMQGHKRGGKKEEKEGKAERQAGRKEEKKRVRNRER